MGEIGKKPNPIVSDHASRSHNIPPILTVDGIIIATLQHKSKQTAEGQTSHCNFYSQKPVLLQVVCRFFGHVYANRRDIRR